jgi:flagellar protein FlaG
MSLDISSFSGRLDSPAHTGAAYRSEKEDAKNGLKTNPAKIPDVYKKKPDSGETERLDEISFSANHQVDYQINQETHDVVIRVVDSESGEVVKQIPGEDFIKLAQRIAEFNQKFVDETI